MTTLLVNQYDNFTITAADASGNPLPATFTASLDNPSLAYLAVIGGHSLNIVPKAPGLVTVTITGASQDGTVLGPYTRQYQINALPVPQATQLQFTADALGSIIIAPADPGTPTVSGAC